MIRIATFFGAGVLFSMGLAWLLAATLDVQAGRLSAAQMFEGEEDWNAQRYDRAGAIYIHSVRARGLNWGPQQAAGAPDTPTLGDQVTAWASYDSDGGTEWLTFEFAKAVVAKEVHVYESCAPGALFKVSVFDEAGHELTAWEGTDPTPVNSTTVGISEIPVRLMVPTQMVKIYLACDKVAGWNEIDAVGLLSDKGELQWARRVKASSTYASRSAGRGATGSGDPRLLAPQWSGLQKRSAAYAEELTTREVRMVDARGWPFVCLMSQRNGAGVAPMPRPQALTPYTAPATSPKMLDLGLDEGGLSTNYTALLPRSGAAAVTTPAGAARAPTPIPLRPIWAGLVMGGAFWGVVLGSMWFSLVIPRRFIREVARFRRGACVRCGYDLGYDFLNGCPECGWRRDAPNRLARVDRKERAVEHKVEV